MKLKQRFYEDFSKDKEMLNLAIIQLSRNIMMIQTNSFLITLQLKNV